VVDRELSAESERLFGTCSKRVREAMDPIVRSLLAGGCRDHVKTIYVGFALDEEMVAAAYPHPGSCDIALALPEDHPSELLEDATHLTWRTMPVLLTVDSSASGKAAMPLVLEALERVATGTHDVERPPEYFKGRVERSWRLYGPLSAGGSQQS